MKAISRQALVKLGGIFNYDSSRLDYGVGSTLTELEDAFMEFEQKIKLKFKGKFSDFCVRKDKYETSKIEKNNYLGLHFVVKKPEYYYKFVVGIFYQNISEIKYGIRSYYRTNSKMDFTDLFLDTVNFSPEKLLALVIKELPALLAFKEEVKVIMADKEPKINSIEEIAVWTKEIETFIYKLLCEKLGVNEDKIKPNSKLVEDLGVDEIDNVEIIMAIEDEFDIDIPDDESSQFKTVKDLIDYVVKEDYAKRN